MVTGQHLVICAGASLGTAFEPPTGVSGEIYVVDAPDTGQ
jgi:hypothetical protein